jgi:hypothetical protein
VRTPTIVVIDVDPQHRFQMAASEDQDPVQALTSHRSHEAFGEGIGVGRSDSECG